MITFEIPTVKGIWAPEITWQGAMKQKKEYKVTEMFIITWLWAMERSVSHTGNEILRGDGWRLSLTTLGMPILDLECQLHFQIGN